MNTLEITIIVIASILLVGLIALLILFLVMSSGGKNKNTINKYIPSDSNVSMAAVYGLRKLNSKYTGKAIKIQKGSDTKSTKDIGFKSDGTLDVDAITSFCGTKSKGYVITWYDQSGQDYDIVYTDNYPYICNNGKITTVGNLPAIYFDGTAGTYLRTSGKKGLGITNGVCLFAKYDYSGANSNSENLIFNTQSSNTGTQAIMLSGTAARLYNTLNNGNVDFNPDITINKKSGNAIATLYGGTSVQSLEINGKLIDSVSQTMPWSGEDYSGFISVGRSYQGYVSEIILLIGDVDSNIKTDIQNNINDFYGVY